MEFLDDLDEQLDDAFDLTKRGLLDDALKSIEHCLEKDPMHAGARALQGYILVLRDELDAAEAAATEALELDPELAAAYFVTALVKRGRGQLDHAVTSFHRAIELEPEDLGYKIELAGTCLQAGRETEGRALLDEIKAIDPFSIEVLIMRAHVAALDGDVDEAESCAEAAVKVEPGNPSARVILAQAALTKDDLTKAAEQARQALALDPDNRDALLLLTHALAGQGNYDEALAETEQHAQDPSSDEIVVTERARLFLLSGRMAEAKTAIDKGLRVAPQSAYLHHLQGCLKRECADFLGAVASYERALELDPSDLGTVQQLVFTYGQLGNDTKARQTIDAAGSAVSTDAGGLLFLAQVAEEAGHPDKARVCAVVALKYDPDNIEARLLSAKLAFLLRDFAKAREEAERVLKQNPENRTARDIVDWLSSAKGPKRWLMRCTLWIGRSTKRRLGALAVVIGLSLLAMMLFGAMNLLEHSALAVLVLLLAARIAISRLDTPWERPGKTPGNH